MVASARTAVVLVAHGSRSEGSNEAHRAFAREVSAVSGRAIAPAFLELGRPDIASAIDAAVDDGATDVFVHPHFLGPGNHTTRDIPDIVEAARIRHPDVRIQIGIHTGADPGLAAVVAASIDGANRRLLSHPGGPRPARLAPSCGQRREAIERGWSRGRKRNGPSRSRP